jgi:hypothetical protein
VQNPNPSSAQLLPTSHELRLRLAFALREVDLLRRLIRVAERAAQFDKLNECIRPAAAGGKHVCTAPNRQPI